MKRKIVFAWGRFNPPTTGHKVVMDRVAKEAKSRKAEYAIFASKSNDPKKNPLTFRTKVKFLKQSFPTHSKNINASPSIKTVLDVMKFLDKRYQEVSLVVGSDRAQEFKRLLNQYNGKEYNFDEIEIISAGERDPDAEDVTGMSASKMRKFAVDGNYKEFKKGSPMKNPKELYNAIRRGMKINEEFCGIMNELHDITDKSIVGRKFNTMLRFGLVKTRDIPITQRSFKDMNKSGTNQELRKHIFDVTDKTLEYIMADDLLYRRFLLLLHDDFLMTEDHRDALLRKADKSRLPYSSLLEVFLRGLASSPIYGNRTAHQYAFDRVNSFIAGGHSRLKLDVDIWESDQQKVIRRKPMKRLRDTAPPAWGTKEMADRYSKVVPGQPDNIGESVSHEESTLPEGKTPEFEVKYSSRKSGPIKVTKFMSQDEAQAFLKKIRGEGMQGIISKGGKPVRTPMKEDAKSERLAKIARAAKARVVDQAKEKAKATEKHNQNSAKSRAGIKYRGNKDQFGRIIKDKEPIPSDADFTKQYVKSRKNMAKTLNRARNEEVEENVSLSKVVTGGSSYSKKGGSSYSKKGGSAYSKKGGAVYSKKGGAAYSKKGGSGFLKKDRFGRVRKEEFEITESDKAEYDKLMKQYGDMPASKIPPKTYMRISQLGRKVRGDKGGPKVGDLLKSMKKRKMGEDVEQVDESPQKKTAKQVARREYMLRTREADRKKREAAEKKTKKKKMGEDVDQVDEAFSSSIIKKMKQVLDRTGMGDINAAMKINDTLPKDAKKVLSKVKNSKELDKYLKANEEVDQIYEAKKTIKLSSGDVVEIGKIDRGNGKTHYYWKHKSGLKNMFPTLEKMRYSLRNDGNFRGAEKVTKQLGEAKMGEIARNVKKGDSPYTVVAIVNKKVVDQDHAKVADQVPALVRELKKEYPNAKISVEDRGGRVVHSESFEAGISEEVDGWVAMYNGKRLEIPNDGKVKGIAGAKAKAIKDLKVPKSKIGMLAIKPGSGDVDEGRIGGGRRSFRGSGMKHIRVRDDEGYRKDGSNPVDDAIAKRNAARRKFAARKVPANVDKNKDPKKKNEEVDEVDEGAIGRVTRAIGNIKDKRITSKDDAARKEKRKINFKKRLKDANREAQWEREDGRKGDSPGTRIKDAQSYAASRSEPSDKAREAAKRIKARRIRQGAEDRRKANEEVDEVDEAKTGSPAWWRAEKERESKLDIRTRVTNRVANAAKDGQKIETSIQARKRRARAEKANEEVDQVEEGGMIGRTKPSRELNVSREEKPHLAGKSSLKDKKRDAHKAERAKAKKQLKSFKGY